MTPETWTGCYERTWHGEIVPEAFTHPAKMARGLVARIFEELLRGPLVAGDLVVDPFGGVGSTGIEAATRGLRAFCCELEPKFYELAKQNFARHQAGWEQTGRHQPAVVRGDSRRLRQVMAEVWFPPDPVAAIVSSPPYATISAGAGGLNSRPPRRAGDQGGRAAASASQDTDARYGQTDGQLSKMSSEAFWEGACAVIRECHGVLRPGGIAVWVVKAFVRGGAVVDFPGQWREACEAAGFETVAEVHASVVTETTHADLFDGERVKRQERKSFWRRMSEAKGGPKIDHEVVWFMRKGRA